jgi:DNA repair protein RecN (Recombination protein N)
MLVELSVNNLVIVADAKLSPGAGLTVISGETGAGKSLLLDAVALLLGERAQSDLVGPNGDVAAVSAVFALSKKLAKRIEERCGIAVGDGQLIIRRRLSGEGRSHAWINDVPVTVAALRSIADALVDIRVQHEALTLSDPARQMELLDAFGGLEGDAGKYRALHQRCLELANQLASLDNGDRQSIKELDFVRFQLREFDALKPQRGEFTGLEQRHAALSGADQLLQLAGQTAEVLSEGDRCVQQILGSLARKLANAPEPSLAQAGQACLLAQESVKEAASLCVAAQDHLHADPNELEKIEERLNAWQELMRKHGDGEATLFTAWETLQTRAAELDGLGEKRERLSKDLGKAREQRAMTGKSLAKARAQAFAKLAKVIQRELADLGMPKCALSLSETAAEPGPLGLVDQQFLVCTNPGMPAGKLADIVSGGEAARLTLAIAVALAEHDQTPVLIFDEVDSGVGGRLGAAIGAKLATLARNRTVLAITHTPQLAASAHRHYVVKKQQLNRSTTVSVIEVTGQARTAEIAEMLGGGTAALGQAKALIAGGAQ